MMQSGEANMKNDRKSSEISIAEADVKFNQSIDDLIEVVLQNMKNDYQNELEPYEHYAKRVRYQIYAHLEKFRDRFVHGYISLINELESPENRKNN